MAVDLKDIGLKDVDLKDVDLKDVDLKDVDLKDIDLKSPPARQNERVPGLALKRPAASRPIPPHPGPLTECRLTSVGLNIFVTSGSGWPFASARASAAACCAMVTIG